PFENKRFTNDLDTSIKTISYKAEFRDVKITSPTYKPIRSPDDQPLSPIVAHLHNLTFMAGISVSLRIIAQAHTHDGQTLVREEFIDKLQIAKIPIPAMSCMSMLYMMPPSLLIAQRWDP